MDEDQGWGGSLAEAGPLDVEEAGHLIQYDQPSKLALEVGLWLGKHSKDGM